MTKKHFISFAQHIKTSTCEPFTLKQLEMLADFCRAQNIRFDRSRWLGYIKGENGPCGGKIKK